MPKPKRKPTLDERERLVAEREAAIATVMPYITPALKNLAAMAQNWDSGSWERWQLIKAYLDRIAERARSNAPVS